MPFMGPITRFGAAYDEQEKDQTLCFRHVFETSCLIVGTWCSHIFNADKGVRAHPANRACKLAPSLVTSNCHMVFCSLASTSLIHQCRRCAPA